MSKQYWVGVDLGKQCFYAALVDAQIHATKWSRWPSREFENTAGGIAEFVDWVRNFTGGVQPAGVCAESAGPLAWRFMSALHDALGAVSLVNPRYISDYARARGIRDKTDRVDACVMASYGLALEPKARAVPSQTQQQLQRLTHLYEATQQDLQAWKNRLEPQALPPGVRRQARKMLHQLDALLATLDAEIDGLIEQDPVLREDARRIETIPGIARKTARVILAEFGDLRGYRRTELTALAGLYPRQFSSGTSVYKKPRITKQGNARVRKALYMPAMVAKRWNPNMATFAENLKGKGLANKAILAAIMRKLLLTARALVVNETDFEIA